MQNKQTDQQKQRNVSTFMTNVIDVTQEASHAGREQSITVDQDGA